MPEALLRLENLTRHFGGVVAVNQVTLSIGAGEVVGLIGPNGAGKTTLVNLITGFTPKTAGKVFFEGRDITAAAPHEIARGGIARTFQIVQSFPENDSTPRGQYLASGRGNHPRPALRPFSEEASHRTALT